MGGTVTVAFLDHSVAPGGAQLALSRVLSAKHFDRYLFIPEDFSGTLGVYSGVAKTSPGVIRRVGPVQPAGATESQLSLISIGRYARGIFQMARALRRNEPFRAVRVVHANSARSAVYGALACAWTNKRLVVHLRDMTNRESLGRFGFKVFTAALRRADGVIANSATTLHSASKFLRKDTHTCIIPSPIGLSSAAVPPIERTEVLRVGMVARIDSWKGQDIAIRAFAKALRGQSVELLLAGAPLFGKNDILLALSKLTEELGISHQVKFLGHIDDIESFILSLDIAIQASTRPEPLGQNVLQYLKLGRPTIAMNEGGPAEWIEHKRNGILVQPRNVEELAGALKILFEDPELRFTLGQSAQRTKGILSDAEVSEAYDSFYRRIQTVAA